MTTIIKNIFNKDSYPLFFDKDYRVSPASGKPLGNNLINNVQYWWTIIIIVTIIFVIIMSILLANEQVSGCEEYKVINDSLNSKNAEISITNVAISACTGTIVDFTDSLKKLTTDKKYSPTGFKNNEDFYNNLLPLDYTIPKFDVRSKLKDVTLDNFKVNFEKLQDELIEADNLIIKINNNIEIETLKIPDLKSAADITQTKVDELNKKIKDTTDLKISADNLLKNNSDKIILEKNKLTSNLILLESNKSTLEQKLLLINNKKVIQDNLVSSLNTTNTNLIDKIKTQKIDCITISK